MLFGGSNHVEKGGNLLHVQDVHHARLGSGSMSAGEYGRDSAGDRAVELRGVGAGKNREMGEEIREIRG